MMRAQRPSLIVTWTGVILFAGLGVALLLISGTGCHLSLEWHKHYEDSRTETTEKTEVDAGDLVHGIVTPHQDPTVTVEIEDQP